MQIRHLYLRCDTARRETRHDLVCMDQQNRIRLGGMPLSWLHIARCLSSGGAAGRRVVGSGAMGSGASLEVSAGAHVSLSRKENKDGGSSSAGSSEVGTPAVGGVPSRCCPGCRCA